MLRLRERMEEKATAPPTGEGKRSAAAPSDPEVVDKPTRRRFAPSSADADVTGPVTTKRSPPGWRSESPEKYSSFSDLILNQENVDILGPWGLDHCGYLATAFA